MVNGMNGMNLTGRGEVSLENEWRFADLPLIFFISQYIIIISIDHEASFSRFIHVILWSCDMVRDSALPMELITIFETHCIYRRISMKFTRISVLFFWAAYKSLFISYWFLRVWDILFWITYIIIHFLRRKEERKRDRQTNNSSRIENAILFLNNDASCCCGGGGDGCTSTLWWCEYSISLLFRNIPIHGR